MRGDLTACGPMTGSSLERTNVTEAELRFLYRHIQLGVMPSVDVLGSMFVVHLDRPNQKLRHARVELLQATLEPARCQHCRDLLAGDVAIVYSAAGAPERYVQLPAGRPQEEQRYAA